jgi:hypothetical protein
MGAIKGAPKAGVPNTPVFGVLGWEGPSLLPQAAFRIPRRAL